MGKIKFLYVGRFKSILIFFFFFFCSCYSSRNIKLTFSPVKDTKYFIVFQHNLVLSQDSDGIWIIAETNFPGSISVVVSNGIFDIKLIEDMTCDSKNKEENVEGLNENEEEKKGEIQKRICKFFVDRKALTGAENFLFWFILKTELGYYTAPNFILVGDKLFDYVGQIKVERKNR